MIKVEVLHTPILHNGTTYRAGQEFQVSTEGLKAIAPFVKNNGKVEVKEPEKAPQKPEVKEPAKAPVPEADEFAVPPDIAADAAKAKGK